MKCSVCTSDLHRVVDTEESGDAIRRRRECDRCKHRWTTYERNEAAGIVVDREAFVANVRSLEALLARG